MQQRHRCSFVLLTEPLTPLQSSQRSGFHSARRMSTQSRSRVALHDLVLRVGTLPVLADTHERISRFRNLDHHLRARACGYTRGCVRMYVPVRAYVRACACACVRGKAEE